MLQNDNTNETLEKSHIHTGISAFIIPNSLDSTEILMFFGVCIIEHCEKYTPSGDPEMRLVVFLDDGPAKPSLTTHTRTYTHTIPRVCVCMCVLPIID